MLDDQVRNSGLEEMNGETLAIYWIPLVLPMILGSFPAVMDIRLDVHLWWLAYSRDEPIVLTAPLLFRFFQRFNEGVALSILSLDTWVAATIVTSEQVSSTVRLSLVYPVVMAILVHVILLLGVYGLAVPDEIYDASNPILIAYLGSSACMLLSLLVGIKLRHFAWERCGV